MREQSIHTAQSHPSRGRLHPVARAIVLQQTVTNTSFQDALELTAEVSLELLALKQNHKRAFCAWGKMRFTTERNKIRVAVDKVTFLCTVYLYRYKKKTTKLSSYKNKADTKHKVPQHTRLVPASTD